MFHEVCKKINSYFTLTTHGEQLITNFVGHDFVIKVM